MSRLSKGAVHAIALAAILLMTPLGLLLESGDAAAQGSEQKAEEKEERKTKKVQALRKFAFEHLNSAHEFIAEEQYDEALEVLGELLESGRVNDHERALMHQTFGYVYYQMDQYPESISEFELALEGDFMADAAAQSTRFNLAQLYLLEERLDEGIEMLLEWFNREETPKPAHYIQLANAYVRKEDYAQALPYAQQGVELAEKPQQSWLRLLLSLELKFEHYRESIPVLAMLLDLYPKKTYWKQLSGVFVELDEEVDAMGAYEMAYVMDFLDDSKEFVRLANMYLYHDVPYKCGTVMEDGLEAERIEPEQENWELLANCWIAAQELERALSPLATAAELSDDGNLWMRFGQVHLENESWGPAAKAFRLAIDQGDLTNPGTTRLLLGISLFNLGEREAAVRAFERAGNYDKVSDQAEQWIKHVEREELLESVSGD